MCPGWSLGGRLREIYVDLQGEELVDTAGEPSTPELAAYFDRLGLLPGEGCEAEVNLGAPAWMSEREELWNAVEAVEQRRDEGLGRIRRR